MKFSIIIPSYNQDRFIAETFQNIRLLKKLIRAEGHELEVLLFDSQSNEKVQQLINADRDIFDFIEIKKDDGQFDAINKGLEKMSGDFWTWLNTDDLINLDGFRQLLKVLEADSTIDYIYGDIEIVNERTELLRIAKSKYFNLNHLINNDPGIFQPGSFFKKEFTNKLGALRSFRCCFDYEFVLRALKNKAKIYCCDFSVAKFRLYNESKSGSIVSIFIREQLTISKEYGRKRFSKFGFISFLRLMKRSFLK